MESFILDGKEFRQVILGRQTMPYAVAEDGTVVRTNPGPGTHKGKILKAYPRGEVGHSGWSEDTVTLSHAGHTEKVAVNTLVQETWHYRGDVMEPYPIEPLELERPWGSAHWHAVLTERDVLEIRSIYKSTRKKYGLVKELSERFGVSRRWIHSICHGDADNGPWRRLLEETGEA